MRRMTEKLHDGRVSLVDGIKVFLDRGEWALVLPDAEEPMFHVYAEAGDDARAGGTGRKVPGDAGGSGRREAGLGAEPDRSTTPGKAAPAAPLGNGLRLRALGDDLLADRL